MSRRSRGPRSLAAGLAATLALAAPAAANFHLMMIAEVYGGDPAAPDAQYVVLQMWLDGQNLVGGHALDFYAAGGGKVATVVLDGDVDDGAEQARILIATSTAERLFGIAADFRMPAELVVAGGKVCFEDVDCVSWGGYSPDDVGAPYRPSGGLGNALAAARRLDVCESVNCSDSELDAADDTNDSANDFASEAPVPRNNAGASGAFDADAVFLHGFEAGTTSGWTAGP